MNSNEYNVMFICIMSIAGIIGTFVFCCIMCYTCSVVNQRIENFYNGDG
jgi:hypothetical protein